MNYRPHIIYLIKHDDKYIDAVRTFKTYHYLTVAYTHWIVVLHVIEATNQSVAFN